MTKCTQQCFCELANSRCSNGCGQNDGWYTAGAYCKKDQDVRKYNQTIFKIRLLKKC